MPPPPLAPLVRALPALADEDRLPRVALGEWPTPVEELRLPMGTVHVKRDDLSGPRYGGNKVRTLEVLLGRARAQGARRVWATGAYGSNHALATVLYARDVGLEPGAMLFPQPTSECARENLVATLGTRPALRPLLSWATLPFAVAAERARARRDSFVMVPGGATPEGALGYVSAVFELGEQIAGGAAPTFRRIVLGVGSTCTSAGLLAGTAVAARLGGGAPPEIWAVRVTPWPVTSAWRIVSLAARTTRLLARLAGDPALAVPGRELATRLRVVPGHIGRGYGFVTRDGLAAITLFAEHGGPPLDTCYSAKAAAGLLAHLDPGPTLFWATKSSRPLPPVDEEAVVRAPAPMRRWLSRA